MTPSGGAHAHTKAGHHKREKVSDVGVETETTRAENSLNSKRGRDSQTADCKDKNPGIEKDLRDDG